MFRKDRRRKIIGGVGVARLPFYSQGVPKQELIGDEPPSGHLDIFLFIVFAQRPSK